MAGGGIGLYDKLQTPKIRCLKHLDPKPQNAVDDKAFGLRAKPWGLSMVP